MKQYTKGALQTIEVDLAIITVRWWLGGGSVHVHPMIPSPGSATEDSTALKMSYYAGDAV